MRDIFELLQHEQEGCKLEIIEHGKETKLGCLTCGTTLLTTEDVFKDIDKFIDLLKLLNKRDSSLLPAVKIIGKNAIAITDKHIDQLARNVLLKADKYFERKYDYKRQNICYDLNIYNEFYSLYVNIPSYKFDNLLKEIYGDITIYKKEVMNRIINKLSNITDESKYTFIGVDGERTVSYCNFKQKNVFDIAIFNEKACKEEEEKLPTSNDIYKFTDIVDFYNKKPDYDDIDYGTDLYYIFNHRIKNNLYDFSNIDKKELLNGLIDTFEEYDGCEAEYSTMKHLISILDIK